MGQRISYEQKDGDSHETMLQGDFWQIIGRHADRDHDPSLHGRIRWMHPVGYHHAPVDWSSIVENQETLCRFRR